MTTIKEVKQAIGRLIKSHGYKKAAYWPTDPHLPESNPLGLADGHWLDRTEAAKSLLAGGKITVDLGYNGRLTHNLKSLYITLADLDLGVR